MGNTLCSCAGFALNKRETPVQSNLKPNIVDKKNSTTPYDNGPCNEILHSNSVIHVNQNGSEVEDFPITPEFRLDSHQSPVLSVYSNLNKRPSLSSSTVEKDRHSIFASKTTTLFSINESNNYGSQVFEFILKHFFVEFYPINEEIIIEMERRNLLTEEDAFSMLQSSYSQNKSEEFLNKFIFSEVNICKIATFLFALVSDRSSVFYNLHKNERVLSSVVDHIYYVVNFISLLKATSNEDEKIKSLIYYSSLISIQYQCHDATNPPDERKDNRPFYIRIQLNDLELPSKFWSIFSRINEDFQCCRELVVSSCNLQPEDIYDLIQGFKSSINLNVLDCSANPITDVGLKHIQSLFQMKNHIEVLNLTCCSMTHSGVEEFLEVLSQNSLKSHLKNLCLSHNELHNMSENGVLILAKLPLGLLEIQSTNIKCQKVLFESLKLNYSLKEIDVSRNRLIDKDLTYLASGLAYNTSLKTISLAMMGLSRGDCGTINNTLLMNKHLVSIDLSDNALGDEGIEILKDIIVMKKTLREIFFKRCNISINGILLLLRQASEPDCHLKLMDLCYNRCPRMSIVLDTKDTVRKINDILHHIGLMKEIRILLHGTIDLNIQNYDHTDCPQII